MTLVRQDPTVLGEMSEIKHPIRVVARLSGLSPHLIRMWERRYGVVKPARTDTNRRLYTQKDIERLRLLREAVDGGRRISDVATLELTQLKTLVQNDRATAPPPRREEPGQAGPATEVLDRCLEALDRLDQHALEAVLEEAAVSLGTHVLRRDVIAPLMHAVGNRWREGSLRVAHEHFISAIVRSMLSTLANGSPLARGAPRIVLTTPAGEAHELGALLAASSAREIGWDVIYLGPNLPANEIALAARDFGARVVGLSVVYAATDHRLAEELRQVARYLDPDVALFVGGTAAKSLKPLLDEIGAKLIEDLVQLQDELDLLR
ncbi:MAG: MerR family transcriptional regulator [Candidatus Latescibacterota bacterium]|nr:MAG: MerR family transcriptional regulator [Candidatus Latescibacterota bacterium]